MDDGAELPIIDVDFNMFDSGYFIAVTSFPLRVGDFFIAADIEGHELVALVHRKSGRQIRFTEWAAMVLTPENRMKRLRKEFGGSSTKQFAPERFILGSRFDTPPHGMPAVKTEVMSPAHPPPLQREPVSHEWPDGLGA